MRKILPLLVLGSFLMVLFVPILVSAQSLTGPVECCKLKRAITLEGAPYAKDTIVGIENNMTLGSGVGQCPFGTSSVAVTQWGMFCILNSIYTVTDWAFIILVLVTVLFIIIGAFTFLLAGGDPEKAKAGQSYILYAVIAIVVALLAKAVPSIVRAVVGM